MKLLRFGPPGTEQPGILDAEGRIRDLSGVVEDVNPAVLNSQQWDTLLKLDVTALPIVEESPRLGPCVSDVGKFICVGLNYADHAEESGMDVPEEPILFFKASSAIVGPDDDIKLPRGHRKVDWEVELGIVIGKDGSYLSESEALDHVAGLCVVNDVSERAFQLERGGQWVKGKSCDTFGPTGPYLVSMDEVGDYNALDLWLDVNGQRMQTGNTRTMIFDVPYLVSYISQFMSLQAGDIISTGTPPGVGLGMSPQVWLKEGDVVELGIQGLGSQHQNVVALE